LEILVGYLRIYILIILARKSNLSRVLVRSFAAAPQAPAAGAAAAPQQPPVEVHHGGLSVFLFSIAIIE
jgi:hypothetical protein